MLSRGFATDKGLLQPVAVSPIVVSGAAAATSSPVASAEAKVSASPVACGAAAAASVAVFFLRVRVVRLRLGREEGALPVTSASAACFDLFAIKTFQPSWSSPVVRALYLFQQCQ